MRISRDRKENVGSGKGGAAKANISGAYDSKTGAVPVRG
jgi:hypothetical protein